MRIAIVNPISETPTSKITTPDVISNRQSIGVQLARALQDAGHECVVYMAEPYRPSRSDEGVECVYFPVRATWVASPAIAPVPRGLAAAIAGGRFEAVVASELFQPATREACIGARASGAVFAVWQELGAYQSFLFEIPARLYYRTMGQWVAARTDVFLPRADRSAEFLRELGVPAFRIGPLLPNGADERQFRLADTERDPMLVVCPGSLVEQKQSLTVLDAFVDYVLPHFPAARLVFKGRGPLETVLRDRVAAAGLGRRVVLDLERSDLASMAALYRTASVGAVASLGKGASLSPVEMSMCGTPVILSRTLYHAQALVRAGAAVAVEPTSPAIGGALVQELRSPRKCEARRAAAAAVGDQFGLRVGARRLGDTLRTAAEARVAGLVA